MTFYFPSPHPNRHSLTPPTNDPSVPCPEFKSPSTTGNSNSNSTIIIITTATTLVRRNNSQRTNLIVAFVLVLQRDDRSFFYVGGRSSTTTASTSIYVWAFVLERPTGHPLLFHSPTATAAATTTTFPERSCCCLAALLSRSDTKLPGWRYVESGCGWCGVMMMVLYTSPPIIKTEEPAQKLQSI